MAYESLSRITCGLGAVVWTAVRCVITTWLRPMKNCNTRIKPQKSKKVSCGYVALSDLQVFCITRPSRECGTIVITNECVVVQIPFPVSTTVHMQRQHFLNGEDWLKCLLKILIIKLSQTQQRDGRQHNRSRTQCNSMCNYDSPPSMLVED